MKPSSKNRLCPALGREITRSECGEKRHSHFACPVDCAHNPFAPANYTALLSTEDSLDRQSISWLLDNAPNRVELERGLQAAMRDKSVHGMHAFVTWNLFFRRDDRGLSCAQRWAQAKFPGLNNDERVFIQAKMQVRVILLEVHRILDEQRIEAVDLLAPESPPMILVDRSLAARLPRFATFLAWVYPLPHFWRPSGTAISLPEIEDFEAVDIVRETVRHLGGPTEVTAMRVWLAENFVRIETSLAATAKERHRLMLASMDAQIGKALYTLQAPFAECRAALAKVSETDSDELTKDERNEGFSEARDWFDDKASTKAGRKLLGRILLGQAFWRLEATGAAHLAELRKRFEKKLGKRVRFDRERRDDIGSRMAMALPSSDQALVPPRLVENPRQLEISTSRVSTPLPHGSKADIEAHFMRDFLRNYADHPVPALEGKTPRQAAGIPLLRKKLLQLLRSQVQRIDETNLRTGRSDDINGLLRELGLSEIDFPPPPRRTPPATAAGQEEDDYPDAEEPNELSERRPFSPLPPGPLSEADVSERIKNALASFPTAEAAMKELSASGASLLEDMDALTLDLLSDHEFSFFISFLLHGWFALVSPGARAPKLDFETMEEELARELERVPSWMLGGPTEAINNISSGCRQPALLHHLMDEMFDASTHAPKKFRPRPEVMVPMITSLKVMLNELDRALRAP